MLVALRRFKHDGRVIKKGQPVTPEPDLALSAKLVRTGFAFPSDGGTIPVAPNVVTYPCDDCGFAGTTRDALRAHRMSAHPAAEPDASAHSPGALPAPEPVEPSLAGSGEFSCPDCDRSFKGEQGLKVHRSRAHVGA